MFYSKRAHAAVTAAYERTIAILHEQLSALQRQLELSLAREAEARRDHAQMAAAVAFPPPPRFPARETPVRRSIPSSATPWDEVGFDDPRAAFRTPEEASLLSEEEAAGLKRALGGEPE